MAKQQMDDEANLKRQARRRLIGAVALVTAAVVILPMVLDREPKPAGQDIELSIPKPDKAGEFKSKIELPADMVPASEPAAESAVANPPTASEVQQPVQAPAEAKHAADAQPQAEAKPQAETKPQVVAKTQTEAQPPSPPKVQPPAEQHATATTKPAAKPVEKAAAVPKEGYAVQVGAFSNAETAKRLQQKLHKQGLPAYTEKIGSNLRVRVGPYTTRAAAEKELSKLKAQGMKPVLAKLD
jgi:DedD protein